MNVPSRQPLRSRLGPFKPASAPPNVFRMSGPNDGDTRAVEDEDPVEGMATCRNTPTTKPAPWAREPSKADAKSADVGLRVEGWTCIGPPPGAGERYWRAFVVEMGRVFSDLTMPKRAYSFPKVGRVDRNPLTKRKRKWTPEKVNRLVARTYGERLKVTARVFGARRIGGVRWYVPSEVAEAYDFARLVIRGRTDEWDVVVVPEALELAVYVARTGPEALRAMRAVNDLEGRAGLVRLAETWWRL